MRLGSGIPQGRLKPSQEWKYQAAWFLQKMEQVFSDNTLSCVHFSGSLKITTVQHEALKHCYTHYYSLSEAYVI